MLVDFTGLFVLVFEDDENEQHTPTTSTSTHRNRPTDIEAKIGRLKHTHTNHTQKANNGKLKQYFFLKTNKQETLKIKEEKTALMKTKRNDYYQQQRAPG